MPTSSDIVSHLAEQGDASTDEVQEQLSALEEGLPDGQSVEDLLQELAPVSVSDDGRRIRAKPTAPDVLPDAPITVSHLDGRMDVYFILWEFMDRYIIRAVYIPILIAILMSFW